MCKKPQTAIISQLVFSFDVSNSTVLKNFPFVLLSLVASKLSTLMPLPEEQAGGFSTSWCSSSFYTNFGLKVYGKVFYRATLFFFSFLFFFLFLKLTTNSSYLLFRMLGFTMFVSSVQPSLVTTLCGSRTYSEDWKNICVLSDPYKHVGVTLSVYT